MEKQGEKKRSLKNTSGKWVYKMRLKKDKEAEKRGRNRKVLFLQFFSNLILTPEGDDKFIQFEVKA